MHGCFALPLGVGFAYEAELKSTMHAISIAWTNGCTSLWLESDSSYVVHLFQKRSAQVLWFLNADWERCLHYTSLMSFRVTHIYQEGNGYVDRLAWKGFSLTALTWWSFTPDFCTSVSFFCAGHEVFRPIIFVCFLLFFGFY